MKVTGTVRKIYFRNEDNGFTVFRLEPEESGNTVKVAGIVSWEIQIGNKLTAEGELEDTKYGEQLSAAIIEEPQPATAEELEKYLASDFIKGIGPEYASRLIKEFGENFPDVVANYPEKLKLVKGIGDKRAEAIISEWNSKLTLHKMMTFLVGHGVSGSKAVKIHKKYGDQAISVVKSNPYRLIDDIYGIGFKSADLIAMKVGFSPDSPLRAKAGVSYALDDAAEKDGHCCLPRNQLVAQTSELLVIEPSLVEQVIDEALENGTLVMENNPEGGCIYRRNLWNNEVSIARRIASINEAELPSSHPEADREIAYAEVNLGIKLSDSQKKAVAKALESKILVITGGPGVGKTTVVNTILQILSKDTDKILLCAPTGRASKRLTESTGRQACTIHRLLEFSPIAGTFQKHEENPLDCDILVADECSMLDVPLASLLLDAIPDHARVILVGDADQLPSVGPGNFLADLIASNAVPVVALTEIFRQKESSGIVRAAHRIHHGYLPERGKPGDVSDFLFIDERDPDAIADVVVKLVSEILPEKFGFVPVRDIQVLCPMHKTPTGTIALNEKLQKALNPLTGEGISAGRFTFYLNDKVMQTSNDYEKGVFNGDIGIITAINKEEKAFFVVFDTIPVKYQFSEADELTLCYATSIHKSQGSEYPVVIIPLSTQHYVMLRRNLIYTGITRGKKMVVLVGQSKALVIAVKTRPESQRFTGLRERLKRTI